MGQESAYWVERYYTEARPLLLKGRSCDALFVSQKKTGISRQLAWMIVKEYAKQGRHQAHQPAQPAPRLCHASGAARIGFARSSGYVGTRRFEHDSDLYPCCQCAAA